MAEEEHVDVDEQQAEPELASPSGKDKEGGLVGAPASRRALASRTRLARRRRGSAAQSCMLQR